MVLSREELAYMAGVIDSDGSVSLSSKRPVPRLTVANTKEVLPRWFHDRLGGNLHSQRFRNPRWRATWYWTLQGDAAVALLKQLRQWLILKREQANVAIAFWAKTRVMRQHVGRGHPRSPELRVVDAEYVAQIRILNQRGVAVKEA